jgi:cyclic pyranopterin phosphate synthase
VRKVRLTGGEPLLRPDVADIVEAFARERADVDVALTTNGQHLAARLPALVAAGLDRVTVHVDSLRPDRYRALMGDGSVEAVLAAAEAARAELAEVKLNVVVQRGKNDDELHDFLAWSRRSGVQVRFIELMNTGSAATYTEAAFVAGKDIVARVALRGAVERVARRAPSDPEPFCDACDRLRLTADGRLRGCLYQAGGVPLGAALKSHPSDEPLVALIEAALDDKRSSHPADAPTRVPFSMADIGG